MPWDPAKSKRGFPRIASQLNYSRRFLSPTAVKVTIPTLPFEAFHNTGNGILPWSFLRTIESCRAFSFYPVAHAQDPDRSLVDAHLLHEHNHAYIVSLKLELSREFHKLDSPKFPLIADINIVCSGTSSKRISYKVSHSYVTSPYAICFIDDVLVDPNTKRPVPFPDWWNKKYGDLIGRKDKTPLMRRLSVPDVVLSGNVVVSYEDIDSNWHTNFASYVKWCFSVLHRHVRHGKMRLTLESMEAGLKTITMLFMGESNLDDKLTVNLWEDGNDPRKVSFVVEKSPGRVCCHLTMEFYKNKVLTSAL